MITFLIACFLLTTMTAALQGGTGSRE